MSNGGGVTNGNDWDAAWSDEEAETTQIEPASPPSVQETPKDDSQSVAAEDLHGDTGANGGQDDDGEDAWGWGDEDPIDADVKAPAHEEPGTPIREKASTAVREVTLTEKYYISSMPKPVLMTIKSIIEDGVILTGQEYVFQFKIVFAILIEGKKRGQSRRSSSCWPVWPSNINFGCISSCITILLYVKSRG